MFRTLYHTTCPFGSSLCVAPRCSILPIHLPVPLLWSTPLSPTPYPFPAFGYFAAVTILLLVWYCQRWVGMPIRFQEWYCWFPSNFAALVLCESNPSGSSTVQYRTAGSLAVFHTVVLRQYGVTLVTDGNHQYLYVCLAFL